MPNFAQLIEQLAREAIEARDRTPGDAEQPSPWDTWLAMSRDWPPFKPVSWPKKGEVGLPFLWNVLWDSELPGVLDEAEELRNAQEEDRLYPESHGARYRREHPDWLAQLAEVSERHAAAQSFMAVDNLMHTTMDFAASPTERARLAWVAQHRARIQIIIDRARAEYFARYP